MKNRFTFFKILGILILLVSVSTSCKKVKDLTDENPDLAVLQQGFKASAAIGYCASLAHMAVNNYDLPSSAVYSAGSAGEYSKSGLIYLTVTNTNKIPFNSNLGDIIIGFIWDEIGKSGVMSIVFADFDVLSASFKFYGVHTVPFIEEDGTGDVITVFAQQDIIIGEGKDTILNLNLSRPQFNLESSRASEKPPTDAFAAVKQNIWFVKVDHNFTNNDINDDVYEVSGGGQLAEVTSDLSGIQYHALIEAKFNHASCERNPTSGTGFIQNIKAGTGIDLGHISLDFHNTCDGQAYVNFAFGSYINYAFRDVNLHFE